MDTFENFKGSHIAFLGDAYRPGDNLTPSLLIVLCLISYSLRSLLI